jgi:tRNA modification GTPase
VISRRDLAGDTIVGIATPAGTGAIGVIRVSGPRAVPIASGLIRLARLETLEACKPRVLHLASLVDPSTEAVIDSALVARMPGPASYTGEDVVEMSCHGNPVILASVVRHLITGGARLAEPGEFTRRAFLSGRMDLLQVEAVAELIGARTERAVELAARQLRGALSGEIHGLRERLLDVMAGLEVALDFPEDEAGLSRTDAAKRAHELLACLRRTAGNARHGRIVHDGLTVVLVGAPNVGKSSILNRLLGTERAIVSAIPGTTRDLVDGTVVFGGVPVRIVDGAGLGSPRDDIDVEGMRRLRQALAESDFTLVVLDVSRPISTTDREILTLTATGARLVVSNKSDLPRAWHEPQLETSLNCSALTGEGIASIARRLEEWVEERTAFDGDEGGVVASLRVLERLAAADAALSRAAGISEGIPVEAALVDLQEVLMELDRILGIEADEAVLDRIFASFCIGK